MVKRHPKDKTPCVTKSSSTSTESEVKRFKNDLLAKLNEVKNYQGSAILEPVIKIYAFVCDGLEAFLQYQPETAQKLLPAIYSSAANNYYTFTQKPVYVNSHNPLVHDCKTVTERLLSLLQRLCTTYQVQPAVSETCEVFLYRFDTHALQWKSYNMSSDEDLREYRKRKHRTMPAAERSNDTLHFLSVPRILSSAETSAPVVPAPRRSSRLAKKPRLDYSKW